MRPYRKVGGLVAKGDFPSFSEGLSLRRPSFLLPLDRHADFPSFSEGLSLRPDTTPATISSTEFPFLFGGTFIEALHWLCSEAIAAGISLPFRRDFH